MLFNLNDKFKSKEVILASASPRRQKLLKNILTDFSCVPSSCDEILPAGISPKKASEYLAHLKCEDIAGKYCDALVIGCDTTVIIGEQILGKPHSDTQACEMLTQLSGKTHKVVSGVSVYYNGKYTDFSRTTSVKFKPLTHEDISAYIATGEPSDKAGAYGIQGLGGLLISEIEGDYFNVVGLPVSALVDVLCGIS